MQIDHQVVVFDAADLAAESSFWAGVLEGTVDAEDDWHMVMVNGEPRVGVQLAPDHIPLAPRNTAPTDPPRPVGPGSRARSRPRDVAGGESVQAGGGRLRRQLSGLCGSCRASVLPVLERFVTA